MIQTDFSTTYHQYAPMLYKIAFVYLGNAHDAEEMVQEAFVRLYTSAPNFQSEEHRKAWLIRVISNLCKNQLSSVCHKRVTPTPELLDYHAPEEGDRELLALVVALPVKYKMPLYLYYYENYSVQEIADTLRLGLSAVKMRLKRGRELLKDALEEREESE